MTTLQPFKSNARDLGQKVVQGELTIADVAEFYLARTARYSPSLNTHLFWDKEDIWRQVEEQQRRLTAGEGLPLAGVPVLIKDNICTLGTPTTCASKMLKNFVPPYDAYVTQRLRGAGALIFGKTNCDEFGMGSSNENSAYGAVRNPWHMEYVPGGSSGGSAAAVAADLAPIALGSDTGGSIRQPAAFCGVAGLKPTYGRVSRYGLIAYSSSLDQIGPMARCIADLALVLDVISGHDQRDATSAKLAATDTCPRLATSLNAKGLRIGLVREFFAAGLEQGTRDALNQAISVYKALGATVEEVSLPTLPYSISAYYLIATAEASANLARFDSVRYGQRVVRSGQSLRDMRAKSRSDGFGDEVKRRILLGTFALSSGYYDAYYAKATAARKRIAADFAVAFSNVDVLLAPTASTTAFKIGAKSEDPLAMYLGDLCTLGVNLAGLPALSVPCGFDPKGLPVGMQLIGPAWAEQSLLQAAYVYEQSCPWTQQYHPQLSDL